MAGVEILATQEVATAFTFNWMGCFIWFGVSLATFLIVGGIASILHDDVSLFVAIVIVGLIFSVAIGVLVGFCDGTPTEYETQYKVTISDEVPMNEFFDKYEIIDQEGKIYTVKDRE